jgi:nitrilase
VRAATPLPWTLTIDGPALDPIRDTARDSAIWVALGITERSSSGTLYNAVVYIDDDGAIAELHRKLVPTGAERLVWANGQGPKLTVIDIGGVRVGSLMLGDLHASRAGRALPQGHRRAPPPHLA